MTDYEMTILPERAGKIWVYLSANPLFWLTAVLVSYVFAEKVAERCHRHPLVNTVAIASAILGALLLLTHTPYQTFFDGAQFVHFLLGPATVGGWPSRSTAISAACARRFSRCAARC